MSARRHATLEAVGSRCASADSKVQHRGHATPGSALSCWIFGRSGRREGGREESVRPFALRFILSKVTRTAPPPPQYVTLAERAFSQEWLDSVPAHSPLADSLRPLAPASTRERFARYGSCRRRNGVAASIRTGLRVVCMATAVQRRHGVGRPCSRRPEADALLVLITTSGGTGRSKELWRCRRCAQLGAFGGKS